MGGVLISRNRTERLRFRRYVEAQRDTPAPNQAASDALLLLRTTLLLEWYLALPLPKPPTLVWNDAQQALIGGWRPAGYSADDLRRAVGQLSPQ